MKWNQERISTEEDWVQMDQQLQKSLSHSRQIGADVKTGPRLTDMITQKRRAELPQLIRVDVSEERFQSFYLL